MSHNQRITRPDDRFRDDARRSLRAVAQIKGYNMTLVTVVGSALTIAGLFAWAVYAAPHIVPALKSVYASYGWMQIVFRSEQRWVSAVMLFTCMPIFLISFAIAFGLQMLLDLLTEPARKRARKLAKEQRDLIQ